MDKRYTSEKIERLLEEVSTPSLDKQKMDSVESKVWYRLKAELNIPDKATDKNHSKNKWEQWLQYVLSNRIVLAGSFAGFIFIIVLGVVISNLSSSDSASINPGGDNTQVVYTGGVVDAAYLQQLASARLEEISGINPTEFESVRTKPQNLNANDTSQNESSSTLPGASSISTVSLDSQRAKDLVQAKNISDDKLFYYETESVYNTDTYLPTGIEVSEPVITKSWTSANYSKTILEQGGKVAAFYLKTPDFSVDYLGGNYAIKEVYSERLYLNGLVLDSGAGSNSEVSFLKAILEDESMARLGQESVDGKQLEILETSYDVGILRPEVADSVSISNSEVEKYRTRYYVDLENFKLYKVETYVNDILQNSQINLDSQEIENPELENYFNTSEIGSVEIKEVGLTNGIDDQSDGVLENFLSKYDLYYVDSLTNDFYAGDNLGFRDSEIYQLRNSIDFNPSYKETESERDNDPVLMSYYGNSKFSAEIYASNILDNVSLDSGDLVSRNIEVQVEDELLPAKYIEFTPNTVSDDCQLFENVETQDEEQLACPAATPTISSYETKYILLEINDRWYKINDLGLEDSESIFEDLENLRLRKMTQDEASRIDRYVLEKQSSYPDLQSIGLNDIQEKDRYLPGSLQQKYELMLNSVQQSTKKPSESKCEIFLETIYETFSCLVESKGGYALYFGQNYEIQDDLPSSESGESTPGSRGSDVSIEPAFVPNNLEIAVLKSNIDVQSILEKIKTSDPSVELERGDNFFLLKNNDLEIYFVKQDDFNLVLQRNTWDREGVSRDGILNIANEFGMDKDLQLLQEELNSTTSLG